MIITKDKPFSKDEIKKLRDQFDVYIKTVIDIDRKICSAGCNRHFDSEQIFLEDGSKQSNLWGGGIDLETKTIDFKSFINIRPSDNNTSNEVQNDGIRKEFEKLMKYFFEKIL